MSKDQLSWEQILKSESASGSAPGASAETSAGTKEGTAAEVSTKIIVESELASEPATKSKPATKTKAKAALIAEAEVFAKKDWRALELGGQKSPAGAGDAVENSLIREPEAKTSYQKLAHELAHEPSDELVEVGPAIITVSQLNKQIRDLLEGEFPLLWVKGEISNFKAHTSGHFYFSLKDAKAQISAVMFRGFNTQLKFRPEDGMEVIIRGKVTVYEPRGNYQIFCELMEPVGAGALQKAFEQLKAKLEREGLFAAERKRQLPQLPRHIAIVTSPTGAAIRDMLNVLARRFKGARITLLPCKVQGVQAAGEIAAAIALANRLTDVDVMIVGRGGGSIEDLWAFNEEIVARAIAGSRIPIVSAVGHEVDFTIADFVADLRAPTPSAAAELVVKNAQELSDRLGQLERGLRLSILRRINDSRQAAIAVARRLIDPQRRLQDSAQRCDELIQRLQLATLGRIERDRMRVALAREQLGSPQVQIDKSRADLVRLNGLIRLKTQNALTSRREQLLRLMSVIDSLSPLRVLERGYAVVTFDGRVVNRADGLSVRQSLSVRLGHGSLKVKIEEIDLAGRNNHGL